MKVLDRAPVPMWFEVVPRQRVGDGPGKTVKMLVDTRDAAIYEGGIWAFYEQLCGGDIVLSASRSPSHEYR